MKQIIAFLFISCYVLGLAQAKSLTVDNQTPGWLSSKIAYGDQQTVKNLIITGYVNGADMKFIGTLIQSHALNGSLNLEECQYVDDAGVLSNVIPSNVFGFSSGYAKVLKQLVMPKLISEYEAYWCGEYYCPLEIDSLTIGGPALKTISSKVIPYYKTAPRHITIREGAISFEPSLNVSSSKPEKCITSLNSVSISLPSTLKVIGKYAFANSPVKTVNLPDGIEEIGEYAFLGCSCFNDAVELPKNLEKFYMNIFYMALPKKIYIGPNVTAIDNRYYYDNNTGGSWSSGNTGYAPVIDGNNIEIYLFSSKPACINCQNGLSKAIIYVPQESLKSYTENEDWKSLDIKGFHVPKQVNIILPEYIYSGENYPITYDEENIVPLIWESKNNDIIQVKDNKVFCIKYGEAIISGHYLYQDTYMDFNRIVYDHTSGIRIGQRELDVEVGEIFAIFAETLPVGTSDGRITWNSEDESIVSILPNGSAKAESLGSVYISATSTDRGYSKECKVTVTSKRVLCESITITPNNVKIAVGKTITLTPVISPVNATLKTTVWKSSNPTVAIVNQIGEVSAISKGTAIVEAFTQDGSNLSSSCQIEVEDDLSDIDSVTEDGNSDVRIFNASGLLVYEGKYKNAHLVSGLYVLICEGKSFKIKVR